MRRSRSFIYIFLVSLLVFLLSPVGLPTDQHSRSKRAPVRRAASVAPQPMWRALEEIGQGTAVVFSPDIARPANRQFYSGLGFLYIETASWYQAIDQILDYNLKTRDIPIQTVIMETHGNWGHGLKLQTGKLPGDARSYISLGALQELLSGSGVRRSILTACNAGRLLRPEIYYTLDERELLPATFGVINASRGYDAHSSDVRLLRRRESQLEMISTVLVKELPASVRNRFALYDPNLYFVVSDLFMQYVLRDPKLHLTEIGYTVAISKSALTPAQSEALIHKFFLALDLAATKTRPGQVRRVKRDVEPPLDPSSIQQTRGHRRTG